MLRPHPAWDQQGPREAVSPGPLDQQLAPDISYSQCPLSPRHPLPEPGTRAQTGSPGLRDTACRATPCYVPAPWALHRGTPCTRGRYQSGVCIMRIAMRLSSSCSMAVNPQLSDITSPGCRFSACSRSRACLYGDVRFALSPILLSAWTAPGSRCCTHRRHRPIHRYPRSSVSICG